MLTAQAAQEQANARRAEQDRAELDALFKEAYDLGLLPVNPSTIKSPLGEITWNSEQVNELRTKVDRKKAENKLLEDPLKKAEEQAKNAAAVTANYQEAQRQRSMTTAAYTKAGTIRTSPRGLQGSPMLTSPLAFSGARRTLGGR